MFKNGFLCHDDLGNGEEVEGEKQIWALPTTFYLVGSAQICFSPSISSPCGECPDLLLYFTFYLFPVPEIIVTQKSAVSQLLVS